MVMQMPKKPAHLHECLYPVSIHIDLAIYDTSSKIGASIEFSHGFENCQIVPVMRSLEHGDANAEETCPPA